MKPILEWAGEKSTITAFLSALTMLGGWAVAPDKIGAVALVVSTVATLALAVVRERK